MSTPPTLVRFDALDELLTDIEADRVWAGWVVTSQFGPESMGSYRRVEFGVDDARIDPTCAVHQQLEDALVAFLEIPETSESERIDGEAVLGRTEDALTIEAEWTRGIPYDWGKSFSARGELLKLGSGEAKRDAPGADD